MTTSSLTKSPYRVDNKAVYHMNRRSEVIGRHKQPCGALLSQVKNSTAIGCGDRCVGIAIANPTQRISKMMSE